MQQRQWRWHTGQFNNYHITRTVFSINSTMHYKCSGLWPVNSTWIKCHICCHKTTSERGPTKDILHYSFEDLNEAKTPLIISYNHIWSVTVSFTKRQQYVPVVWYQDLFSFTVPLHHDKAKCIYKFCGVEHRTFTTTNPKTFLSLNTFYLLFNFLIM